MARQNIYSGSYDPNSRTTFRNAYRNWIDLRWIHNMIIRYFWMLCSVMSNNYLAVTTVIAVVMLSFIIPDISKRLHATSDLEDMKKVLDMMTEEVRLAEVACLTDVNEICHLHGFMHDDATETTNIHRDISMCTNNICSAQSVPVHGENKKGFLRRTLPTMNTPSHKEIAIMSYIYTDSFDKNHKIKNTKVSER